jgi:hypothetical protein
VPIVPSVGYNCRNEAAILAGDAADLAKTPRNEVRFLETVLGVSYSSQKLLTCGQASAIISAIYGIGD